MAWRAEVFNIQPSTRSTATQLRSRYEWRYLNCEILDLKQKDGFYVALCLEILEREVVAALAAG